MKQCGRAVERVFLPLNGLVERFVSSAAYPWCWNLNEFAFANTARFNHINLPTQPKFVCVKEVLEILHELHRRDSHLSFQAQQSDCLDLFGLLRCSPVVEIL